MSEEASRKLNALNVLRNVPNPTPAELDAIARLEAREDEFKAALGATAATYRGARSGATFGLDDEIYAGFVGATSDRSYDDALTDFRATEDASKTAFPDEFSRGKLAGAGASSMLPFGLGVNAMKNAPIIAQLMMGAGAGGAVEMARGFFEGRGGEGSSRDQAWNRASNISGGDVAVGTGVGAAAPIVGRIVGRIAGNKAAPLGRDAAELGYDQRATALASRALNDDASVMDDVAKHLSDLGPEGVILDVGRNTRSQGSALTRSGGPGAQRTTTTLDQRASGTGDRVSGTLTDVGGGVKNQVTAREARRVARTATAGPLYESAKAYDVPLDTSEIVAFINNAERVGAPGSAQMSAVRKILVDSDGNPAASALALHNQRSKISDASSEASRAGRNNEAVELNGLLAAMDNRLDGIEGYASARKIWSDSKALDDAALEAKKFFGTDADELEFTFGKMTASEQAIYREAVRKQADLKMTNAVQEGNAAVSSISPKETKRKFDIVFGAGAGDKLASREGAERIFRETRTKVAHGSETASNQIAAKEIAPFRDADGLRISPLRRAKTALIDDPINDVVDQFTRPRKEVLSDLAAIHTSTGLTRDVIVQALLKDALQNVKNKKISDQTRSIVQALMQSGAAGYAASE